MPKQKIFGFFNFFFTEKLESLTVEKCPDKTAKLVFEIKMKKLGEVEDPENDTSFIQSNQPFKKSSIKSKLPNNNKNALPDKPNDKKPLEKTNTIKSTKETTPTAKTPKEKENDSSNSSNTLSKPPPPKKAPQKKKETSSEASDSEEGSEGESGSESNESGSESGSGSGSEEESKTNKKKSNSILNNKPPMTKNNSFGNKNNNNNNSGNKFFNNPNNDLNLSNIRSVKTVNSDDQLSQKIKSLLKDSNNGSKDSTKIEPNLRKLEMEEKKIGLPANFNKQDDSDDDNNQMFAEFSAQKIKQLELKLNAKIKENQETVQKVLDLEEELKHVFFININ